MELQLRRASPDDLAEILAIDDDACSIFPSIGLDLVAGPEHPFVRAERDRFARSIAAGTGLLAGDPPCAILLLSEVDGAPYVEQLSVRVAGMRKGLGRRLLAHAREWAAARPLWLTTYDHVPWNGPFYEREGFARVADAGCPGGILELLAEQRRYLPAPEHRVAMRFAPEAPVRTARR